MNVRDVMTTDIMTCMDTDTLSNCATTMKKMNIGSTPVVNAQGDLVGIITDRDITIRASSEGISPNDAKVRDFMSSSLITVDPNTNVEDAAIMMADNQIRRLLVTSDGRLVGIVSLGDLAVDVGEEELVGETLESISRPTR